MSGAFPISVALCAAIIALSSCQILDPNDSRDDARIRFGKSIDGVEIGMDSSAVINRLGRPHYIGIGDFYGVIFSYVYPSPDGPGYRDSLEVTIFTNPNDANYGVGSISVRGPYSGRTGDGIGIGSSRDVALNALGAPDHSDVEDSSSQREDVYEWERTHFKVTYTGDEITGIWLGGRR